MIKVKAIHRSAKLSEVVSDQLSDAIRKGLMESGARLPAERELAEQFGVSRVVVREALSRMKSDGLIETRQGSGAFVASEPDKAPFRVHILDRSDLRELFDLRLAIEGTAAGLAAEHSDATERRRIKDALAALQDDILAGRSGVDSDQAFHRAIADASHNRYVSRLVAFLGAHLQSAIRAARSNTARRHRERIAAVQEEHKAILSAIENRSPAAAEAAMRLHLANAADRLGVGRPVHGKARRRD